MNMNRYTNERNHQILISLLKSHGIRQVIASPGMTNSVFIGSIQNDPYFQIYSSVDERSAAYIACGLALESGEPVIISCTGATAARNYMSGATEAYYSKLPILILTSSQPARNAGHLIAQVTDRSSPPKDTCTISITAPSVSCQADEWECEVACNKALLELRRRGGGPVHLNLVTTYSFNEKTALTAQKLPDARIIRRVFPHTDFPLIPKGKMAIFIGSHKPIAVALQKAIEKFCESNNAVVLCDHTSNYYGKYRIPFAIVINQASINKANIPAYNVDILIHIGEVSGEEGASRMIKSKETWRVSEDGEIRDTFKNVSFVFEMPEKEFFARYVGEKLKTTYYKKCLDEYKHYMAMQDEQLNRMPFSNVWIAKNIAPFIPRKSSVELSILNTLRTWNYTEFPRGTNVFSPVGGFGIDGAMSMLIGASLNNPSKLFFCITGDLAFFYDMNSLGNRSLGNNIRILLVNNGCGVEFKKSYAMSYRLLGEEVMPYVAAAGHFGNKSVNLVRHYTEDLGFKYLCASNKDEFLAKRDEFLTVKSGRPIILEAFIEADDDCSALDIIHNRK